MMFLISLDFCAPKPNLSVMISAQEQVPPILDFQKAKGVEYLMTLHLHAFTTHTALKRK